MAQQNNVGSQVPVSDTLAQLLQALQLGAWSTVTEPNGGSRLSNSPATLAPAAITITGIAQQAVPALDTATIAQQAVPASATTTTTIAQQSISAPATAVATVAQQATLASTGAAPVTSVLAPLSAVLVPMDPCAVSVGASEANIDDFSDQCYYVVTIGRKIGVFSPW
ncbi:hypothetical protein C0993_004879 [Termitomyces sp. T159_Od127]|nr:hypothetical protein C0993_004879 [Termitomyces sp. T159_Od127]